MRLNRIKKIVGMILIAGLFWSMLPQDGWAAAPNNGVINGSNVQMRLGAGTDFQSIGVLQKGDKVQIMDSHNGWYQICTVAGKWGWVAGWLVDTKTSGQGLAGKVVVIDPGHGGIQSGGWTDPGAVGSVLGITDRDVGMAVSLELQKLLTSAGAKVVLTHTGKTTLTLAGRAKVANDLKADVFVSIHGNANINANIKGIEVYYYSPDSKPNLAAQRKARTALATSVKDAMVAATGRSGKVLTKNLAVLRETNVPSILVELGYLSNREEEALLATVNYQKKLAQGIFKGIENYLK